MHTHVSRLLCRTYCLTVASRHSVALTKFQVIKCKRDFSSRPERSENWANELVKKCSDAERTQLIEALQKVSTDPESEPFVPCTMNQLRLGLCLSISICLAFLASATPFIGFGFLDNLVMILAVSKPYYHLFV